MNNMIIEGELRQKHIEIINQLNLAKTTRNDEVFSRDMDETQKLVLDFEIRQREQDLIDFESLLRTFYNLPDGVIDREKGTIE